MAADMVAFAHGLTSFSKENEYMPADAPLRAAAIHTPAQYVRRQQAEEMESSEDKEQTPVETIPDIKTAPRSIVVVCPSRELAYPLSLVKDIAADTTSADFGQFNTGDILKSAQKWIDLSDSETIWRD